MYRTKKDCPVVTTDYVPIGANKWKHKSKNTKTKTQMVDVWENRTPTLASLDSQISPCLVKCARKDQCSVCAYKMNRHCHFISLKWTTLSMISSCFECGFSISPSTCDCQCVDQHDRAKCQRWYLVRSIGCCDQRIRRGHVSGIALCSRRGKPWRVETALHVSRN